MDRPGVGVGIYVRKGDKILMSQRKGIHGPDVWCAPGGHLEMEESWEECARREVLEETGVEITNIRFDKVTNDIFPDGTHYVAIHMCADWESGEPLLLEPKNFTAPWRWLAKDEIPQPLFLSAENYFKAGGNPF